MKDLAIRVVLYAVAIGAALMLFFNILTRENKKTIFAFTPMAITHGIIEERNMFYNLDMVNARYYLYAQPKFSPKLVAIELYSLTLYLGLNLGTRLIGLGYIVRQLLKRRLTHSEGVMLVAIACSTFFGTCFSQTGDWWNTIQFFYFGTVLLNYFAAQALYSILQAHKKLLFVFGALVIVATLPPSIDQLTKIAIHPAVTEREENELAAYHFLSLQPTGSIFALPPLNEKVVVPAYTAKPVYYAMAQQLELTGIDYKKREKDLKDKLNLDIANLPVQYFFVPKDDTEYATVSAKLQNASNVKKTYENSSIEVYQKLK